MKYLLPLSLIAAATWAAARDTRPFVADQREPAPSARGAGASDPPWLTGALDLADVALEGSDDPHAGLYVDADGDPHAGLYVDADGEDPHAGLFADGEPPMGMCTRTGSEDGWGAGGEADADPHGDVHAVAAGVDLPAAPLAPPAASNGHSIAEIHARRAALAEQTVRVRGMVVKRTDDILGETYLHLRDGSGSAERADDDLTVTTSEEFTLGETVEIEGRLRIDQDLGFGYRYPALLASAKRVVER